MGAEYGAYLESVRRRLDSDKFVMESGIKVGNLTIDLMGHKDSLTTTRAFSLSFLQDAEPDSIRECFREAGDSVERFRGRKGNFIFFPVLTSPTFGAQEKRLVQSRKGIHFSGFGTRWQKETVVHPVLAELQSQQIFHFSKLTFVYLVDVWRLRRFASKHFSFTQ